MSKYKSVYSILDDVLGEYDYKNAYHVIGEKNGTTVRISYQHDEYPDFSYRSDEDAQNYEHLIISVGILPNDSSSCKACKQLEDFSYSSSNPCTCKLVQDDVCGGVENYLNGYGAVESEFVTDIVEDMLSQLLSSTEGE